jgi:hypothetical protein
MSAAVTAAIILAVGGVVFGGGAAQADTSLIGFTAQADANTFDLVVDNASGLGGVHPLSEVDLPEDFSNFETGPLGYALASILWPGSAGGNVGALSGELGLPSELAPLAGKLNDPIKAESFYPAGPATATFPSGNSSGALEMSSGANASQSWAKAGFSDVSVPGLFDLQTLQGSTVATATTKAQSIASGSFSGLSLLGGLVQIGATSSTAWAASDGTSPSGTSTSHIGAITIAGHTVSVGSDGFVVGPLSSGAAGLLAIPTSLVNQVISALNLQITVLPQTQTSVAPAEEISSGALSISFALPPNLNVNLDCSALPAAIYSEIGIVCDAPQELDGFKFTLTLGRVMAAATATQPFADALVPSGLALASPLTPPTTTLPFTNSSFPTQSGIAETTPTVAPTPTSTTPAQTAPHRLLGLVPVSLSSPITAGLMILLLALAAAVGIGLRRMASSLGAPPPEHCPLEDV